MSDEEFDRKIQQLRNEGYDDFADAINGLRAEITAERQVSKRVVAGGLEFRNHIASLLPETWYADLSVEERFRLLVEQWQKLQRICEVELTRAVVAEAECNALRDQFHTQAEQRDFVGNLVENMPHAQIAAELTEFKAEVAAALGGLHSRWLSTQAWYALAYDKSDGAAEIAQRIAELNIVITKLGLAPGENGQ